MNTFLPFPDFEASAKCLDSKRLGKQRAEVLQLLRIVTGHTTSAHPAANMWRGHVGSLAKYGVAVCTEWRSRGYRDTLLPIFEAYLALDPVAAPPPWLGDAAFHASHRSNLKRKDPEHYKFADPPYAPYVWPTLPSSLS